MSTRPLEAGVRDAPGIAIIDPPGVIDAAAEEALHAAYQAADSRRPDTILLNFRDVDYINSTGIALIVGLLAKSRQSGRQLTTCGLSEHYVEIFRISRLA